MSTIKMSGWLASPRFTFYSHVMSVASKRTWEGASRTDLARNIIDQRATQERPILCNAQAVYSNSRHGFSICLAIILKTVSDPVRLKYFYGRALVCPRYNNLKNRCMIQQWEHMLNKGLASVVDIMTKAQSFLVSYVALNYRCKQQWVAFLSQRWLKLQQKAYRLFHRQVLALVLMCSIASASNIMIRAL